MQNQQGIVVVFHDFYSKLYKELNLASFRAFWTGFHSLRISRRVRLRALTGFCPVITKPSSLPLSPCRWCVSSTPFGGGPPQIVLQIIPVIPKLGKDHSNCRPISLINNDLYMLTKIMVNRLSAFISRFVHKDQMGFIPGRQGPDEIHRAVVVISLLWAK